MRIARTVTLATAGLALITTLAACGGGVDGSAQAAANGIEAAIKANRATAGSVTDSVCPIGAVAATGSAASTDSGNERMSGLDDAAWATGSVLAVAAVDGATVASGASGNNADQLDALRGAAA